MMKFLMVVSLLLAVAAPDAAARGGKLQTDTQDFAVDKCTSTTLAITSATVVNVLADSVYLASATFMEVYNVVGSTWINCGWNSSVSSSVSSALYGREIEVNSGLGLTINVDKFHEIGFHCRAAEANARATVTKCR